MHEDSLSFAAIHLVFIVPVDFAVSITEDDRDVLLNDFYNVLAN